MGPRLAWLAVLLLGALTLWVVTGTPAAARQSSESSPAGGLRVGFARVDITPDRR